jgi:hypothetical protein
VRGLTNDERAALTEDATFDDDLMDRLVERGLLRFAHHECCSCGEIYDECDCEGYEQEVFDVTPAGLVALRLDAAARAIGLVSA